MPSVDELNIEEELRARRFTDRLALNKTQNNEEIISEEVELDGEEGTDDGEEDPGEKYRELKAAARKSMADQALELGARAAISSTGAGAIALKAADMAGVDIGGVVKNGKKIWITVIVVNIFMWLFVAIIGYYLVMEPLTLIKEWFLYKISSTEKTSKSP